MRTIWKGSVRSLVSYTAGTDARETVVDAKTGAEIAINISGGDFEETDEPFYIWYKDEMYDAYNQEDAVRILSNIRKGKRHPDLNPTKVYVLHYPTAPGWGHNPKRTTVDMSPRNPFMTIGEFMEQLRWFTKQDLITISENMYRRFSCSPWCDRHKTKERNIEDIVRWVRGDSERIQAVLDEMNRIRERVKQAPTTGTIPHTRYISYEEFRKLPSASLLERAITYRHDHRRACHPVSRDGYLTVDAIYNMSAWANWMSSSLGEADRRLSEAIYSLPLLELMNLNRGRKKNQPALFPVGMLKNPVVETIVTALATGVGFGGGYAAVDWGIKKVKRTGTTGGT